MAGKNANLHAARANKNDEFYTQMKDIEDELVYYREHFRGKTILLNCDDPDTSNFWKWFEMRFDNLGLKKLISTHYNMDGTPSYKLELTKEHGKVKTPLKGNGDFASEECLALLEECDIVCTNPPFSLFRAFVATLMEHEKKFLIIGNQNAITYKEIFPLMKEDKMWLGYKSGDMAFMVPDHYEPRETRYWQDETGQKWRSLGNVCWYTNLDHELRHTFLTLYKKYKPELYPHYDNYDAIEVSKVAEIPRDYEGVMGVPITFMDKYCPEQFVLVGATESEGKGFSNGLWKENSEQTQATINGQKVYKRLFVRNKHPRK